MDDQTSPKPGRLTVDSVPLIFLSGTVMSWGCIWGCGSLESWQVSSLGLACQISLCSLERLFFFFFWSSLLPPGLSLLYFCQRSEKCHCAVVQSHQGLSKTICMHGPYDFCWSACGDGGSRGIWRPLEEEGRMLYC